MSEPPNPIQDHKEATMRFMMLYKPGWETDAPPTEQEIMEMGQFTEELAKEGVLLAADGLKPSSKGSGARITNGKFAVTDGPFTETKELNSGFAIVEVKSKAQAIDLAKRFLKVVGERESEIRVMHDTPGFDAASASESTKAGQKARGKTAARA
jgi:hypothetical protein